MVLTRSQYENMSKEELIQELTDINSSFVYDINTKLTNLDETFMFEWTLDDIKIEKIISSPNWATIFFRFQLYY